MVLYGSALESRAGRAAAAARHGLIEPPEYRNFPLHAGRGLEPVMGRERAYDVRWTASSATSRDGFQPAQARDEAVLLGYRIGPLPTDPLPADRYTEALAANLAGPREQSTRPDILAATEDLLAATNALGEAFAARRAFHSTKSKTLLAKSDAALASAESQLGDVSRYIDYVEPRGFRARWQALCARMVDGWGHTFFARRFRPGSLMAFEPNSLRAAEFARRAGRFELRDQILAAHRPTMQADIVDPKYANRYSTRDYIGERAMQRALRSGLVLVDADDVDALKSFHAAATFVGRRMKRMQSQLTPADPSAPLDTPDTSGFNLSFTFVKSFELNGGFNPLWQVSELYADARVSYATGLRLRGEADERVKHELTTANEALRSAAEANALAQRVIGAYLAAGRANSLFRSCTLVKPERFWTREAVPVHVRDVTADVQAWLDADLVPAATRLATKQHIVAALVAGGTTLAGLATPIGPD